MLTLITPGPAQAIDIIAPQWAYQVRVGQTMPELRTLGGVRYRSVRIEAITALQIQFSHSRGQVVENLTNIIDPNTYAYTPAPAPAQQADNGHGPRGDLSRMMTAAQREVTGVDQLSQSEQSGLAAWLRTGVGGSGTNGIERLTPAERANMVSWLNARREANAPGSTDLSRVNNDRPPLAVGRLPIHSTLAGEFTGFAPGQIFNLHDGSRWKQVDDLTVNYYRSAIPVTIKATVRASGGAYVLDVEGAKSVRVKPIQ